MNKCPMFRDDLMEYLFIYLHYELIDDDEFMLCYSHDEYLKTEPDASVSAIPEPSFKLNVLTFVNEICGVKLIHHICQSS
jgi:hypothetical protein